jgi:peptide/nickel transport system permease protein
LGIVGESGSGKSVATSSIPRLLPKSAQVEGSIRYYDTELVGASEDVLCAYRGRKIGMIFQEPGRSYDPLQKIGAVFWETFRVANPAMSRAESDTVAVKLLEETGISEARRRLSGFPHQFSGGQLQRIGIALALAQDCELLIADEPTTALDVTIQTQIVNLLKDIRARRNISILFISHNINVVAAISDRIMVMYGGLIMETGDASTLLSHPRHPYTRALLNAAPRFGSHYSQERLVSIPGRVPDPRYPAAGCPFAPRCPESREECARNSSVCCP